MPLISMSGVAIALAVRQIRPHVLGHLEGADEFFSRSRLVRSSILRDTPLWEELGSNTR